MLASRPYDFPCLTQEKRKAVRNTSAENKRRWWWWTEEEGEEEEAWAKRPYGGGGGRRGMGRRQQVATLPLLVGLIFQINTKRSQKRF